MTTAATKTDRPAARRRLLPQFSLAAALIAMTVCSVGLWYWYRVPFEVTHELVDYDFLHDPLMPAGSQPVKQTETVRRVWGGKTIRHGLLTTRGSAGQILAVEEFREDARNGKFERWYDYGAPLVTGQFMSGLPQGEWVYTLEFDLREAPATQRMWVHDNDGAYRQIGPEEPFKGFFPLGRVESLPTDFAHGELRARFERGLPDGEWQWIDPQGKTFLRMTFDEGQFVKSEPPIDNVDVDRLLAEEAAGAKHRVKLLRSMQFQFVACPLFDAFRALRDAASIPLFLDAHALEEAGINFEAPVTCRIDNLPLVAALGEILKPHDLGAHFRYGGIWITTKDVAHNWKDETGVSQMQPPAGSKLAAIWEEPAGYDFIETPLSDACMFLSQKHAPALKLDLRGLTSEQRQKPVTGSIQGLAFKDGLAIILDRLQMRACLDGDTIVIEP